MSVVCFTCSDATGAVSPLSNTCYWGILCSLLLPDENIEHVCFPNPKLQVCTKCMQMLDCISEFRNVAVNSVRTQLGLWSRATEPLSDTHYAVKVEIEKYDVKQELCDENPGNPGHEITNLAGARGEVMLEKAEEISSQLNIEQQTQDSTDNKSELVYWDHWLLGAPDSNAGDGAAEHHVESAQSEAIVEDAVDPEDEPRSEPKPSTAAIIEERTKQPEQSPKKKKKYITRKIKKAELEVYRSRRQRSRVFRRARHKCGTCLLVFDTKAGRAEHRLKCHSKKCGLQECMVCKQTMVPKALAKHIASHFQLMECPICGYLTHDKNSIKTHICFR